MQLNQGHNNPAAVLLVRTLQQHTLAQIKIQLARTEAERASNAEIARHLEVVTLRKNNIRNIASEKRSQNNEESKLRKNRRTCANASERMRRIMRQKRKYERE